MIDTVCIKYKFPDINNYNECYSVIDNLTRETSCRLHKIKKKTYITTALASMGLSEIRFFKQKNFKGNIIQLTIKPARFIVRDSYLRLSDRDEDYKVIENIFNHIIDYINNHAEETLLPRLVDWKVYRIDYAFDIEIPDVQKYINLFKRGFVPKGFRHYKNYETSIYMTSKNCRINFYDKLTQLKSKYGLTDNDIEAELKHLPTGILRLEIQCDNKKIQQIKEKYNLPENSIEYLWNETIAFDIISHYIKAIIGEEDCYTLQETLRKLQAKHGTGRAFGLCSRLITTLATYSDTNLNEIKKNCQNKNEFKRLIFKIRRAKVNPITLEAICDDTDDLKVLINPCRLIQY